MRAFLASLVCLLVFAASSAIAREQSEAPNAEVIGFSPDGRYFAWEQYGWDVVSGIVFSAVFVIDRNTNQLVAEFPIGLLPEERDGLFPAQVGGFDPDPALIDTGDGTPDLIGLRNAVRAEAEVRLKALEIGLGGRRVAGIPLTQRGPIETPSSPLRFVVSPTLPSAIPDQQYTYAIEPDVPGDPLDCANVALPAREKTITFKLTASTTWPEAKDVATASTSYVWNIPAEQCATGIWISDIVAPPAQPLPETGGSESVVVLFMASMWSSAVDSAVWQATYVNLPAPREAEPKTP